MILFLIVMVPPFPPEIWIMTAGREAVLSAVKEPGGTNPVVTPI